jgi:hypothetical protein
MLAATFLSVVPVLGQKEAKKPRIMLNPPAFIKAEAFLELSGADQMMYTTGLVDGFYASTFFGATNKTVANLTSCVKDMDNKQVAAIITKYVKDHPEQWHFALSALAHSALNSACPGGLRVVDEDK